MGAKPIRQLSLRPEKGYRPEAIRRVWIEKPNGGQRPLGIATIRDRVVQMAVVLVIEPIFEADLQPEQYGYRPKRSVQDAVRAVHGLLNHSYREVIDADLSGYFDTIPHSEMIQCVARRISDREMLALIKRFLKAPVQDQNDRGPSGDRQAREEGPRRVHLFSAAVQRFPSLRLGSVDPSLEEDASPG